MVVSLWCSRRRHRGTPTGPATGATSGGGDTASTTAAAPAVAAVVGVPACARLGSARRCAGGSGDWRGVGRTSSWGSLARRAPAGAVAQAALLAAQAVPRHCAVYALDDFFVRLPFVEPPPSRMRFGRGVEADKRKCPKSNRFSDLGPGTRTSLNQTETKA